MSYCVNCGVKLSPSERKCPLCSCPVNNPMDPFDPRVEKPYPGRSHDQDLKQSRLAAICLAAVLLLTPAGICVLVDLAVSGAVTWSLYPTGALAMVFVTAAAVLSSPNAGAYLGILAGDASLCLYLLMVQQLSGGGIWFQAVVFPVLLLTGMMSLAMVASIRQRVLHGLAVPAVLLMLLALTALAVDLLVTVQLQGCLCLTWAGYVMIPCGVIALLLLFIHHNAPLRSQLKRMLHL